ncbi:MAG: hypothetical protein EOL88_10125, partial [Bacteroidia bacterium]|nr:hypothetical protein [Bacteroidia bacterium]
IVPTSTPGVTSACAAVKNTPVAFTYTYDPIAAGAGTSSTDHLPNISGVGSFPPVKKTFELIKTLFPEAKTIGTIYNSSEANSRKVISVAEEILQSMNLTLRKTTVVNSNEVIQAIQVLVSQKIDVLWITGDNTAMQGFDAIAGTAAKANIPVIINDVDLIGQGALAAVGIGWYATGYHSAQLIARVMNGEDPSGIPIENFVTEQIVFNPELVKKYAITLPDSLTVEDKKPYKIPEKKYVLALAHYVDSPNSEAVEKGILQGLADMGLTANHDYTLKILNAQGDVSTLNSIAESLKSETYDLIFTSSSPTIQVISKKITDTPVVFSAVGDPVAAGIAESREMHRDNITGISTMSDFEGMLAMVKDLLPEAKTLGTVYIPGEVNSVSYVKHFEAACISAGMTLIKAPASNATEIMDAANSLISKGVDGVCQISDNLTASSFASIITVTEKAGIPIFSFISSQVDQGSVAAVARDFQQAGYDAAMKAGKILSGTNPKSIPWDYVSKTIIRVNPKNAKKYGISVPQKYRDSSHKENETVEPHKIAFLHFMSSRDCSDTEEGFREGLALAGWEEKKDFVLEIYNAQSEIAMLPSITAAIAMHNFDLIVSNVAPPAQALAQQITNVPQIFTIVADPVGSGLGKSYTDHLPHVTGIDGLADTDAGVALVLECLPKTKTIGTLLYPGETGPVKTLKALQASCKNHGIALEIVTVNTQAEVADAINTLCRKEIDAILQIPDNVSIAAFSYIVKTAKKMKKPLFCFISEQVRMGAIAGATGDYSEQGKEAAALAIKILNGQNPAEIPFQSLKAPHIVINCKAAREFGVMLPATLLHSADEKIAE